MRVNEWIEGKMYCQMGKTMMACQFSNIFAKDEC